MREVSRQDHDAVKILPKAGSAQEREVVPSALWIVNAHSEPRATCCHTEAQWWARCRGTLLMLVRFKASKGLCEASD